MEIKLGTNILAANESIAAENRERLHAARTLALNLISSPGAGKTALLERTVGTLASELRLAVVEGDITTALDAERIRQHGVPATQINTGGGCHLDANMVSRALPGLLQDGVDILFIENVGNLVCPAGFDLGEEAKIALVSLAEGDDKPLKYPALFRDARAVVINKIDLAPHVDADLGTLRQAALSINPDLVVFELSCRTGEGLAPWFAWLRGELESFRARCA